MNPPFNAPWQVLRGKRLPGRGQTLASRHAPFGTTRHGNGMLVHRPARVVLIWRHGDPASPYLMAGWLCGNESNNVQLHDEPPTTRSLCPECESKHTLQGTGFVYYAARDGKVKIGYSANPVRRIAQLHAELLAVEPGSLMTERERHLAFSEWRVAGEWFWPGKPLADHIESLRAAA